MSRARQGKIARLPRAIREAVNRRLEDGQAASEILPWLNSLPEVVAVLDSRFAGEAVSEQNLSGWRSGGYLDWTRQRDREDNLRLLADYSHRLAQAGGTSLAKGAANVAAGHILEVLETIADGSATKIVETDSGTEALETGPDAGAVIKALASLRKLEIAEGKLDLDRRKTDQREREIALAERRFQTLAVETFLTWAKSEDARKILDLGQPKHIQAARLRELMFGPSPVHDDPA